APNPEATFSLLNFSGFYAYITALRCEGKSRPQLLSRDAAFLLAGCLFGAATLLRSNGLLSGSLFAYDAILEADKQLRRRRLVPSRRMLALLLGGGVIFVAFALPQAIAFMQFCGDEGRARPWCGAAVPTIYGFVQKNYWDVGFLRYWKLSNLPLFLLAAPMLATLVTSTTIVFNHSTSAPKNDTPGEQQQQQQHHHSPPSSQTITSTYLLRLSIPQLILAVSALAIYHVQIINRIASGYPVWYWYIALLILSPSPASVADVPARKREKVARALVTAMVMYGLIQGVLYANFLPPA
ncbi:ER membrane glycoprotein subunit of the GPI transamidase complex-like protein, partial [Ascosphaera atra]